jgi:hypothetical protein
VQALCVAFEMYLRSQLHSVTGSTLALCYAMQLQLFKHHARTCRHRSQSQCSESSEGSSDGAPSTTVCTRVLGA